MNILTKLFSKNHTVTLKITSSSGFHLRPVAAFVAKAKTFKCPIEASFKNKTVSAKAVNTLLSLNLDKEDTFELSASGKCGEEALQSLQNTFHTLMDNDEEVKSIEKQTHHYHANVLTGEIISKGIGIAPLFQYQISESYTPNNVTFSGAVVQSIHELSNLYESHKSNPNANIYLAQKELLLALASDINDLEAFEKGVQKESQTLRGGKLEAKISDYQDLLRRIKAHMGYHYEVIYPDTPFILLADDLLPSDIHALASTKVEGVILKHTSPTSHTAILLRASGISSMIMNDDITIDTHEVILDATTGVLVGTPTTQDMENARSSRKALKQTQEEIHTKRHQHAITRDQKKIDVVANISDLASAQLAKKEGAEGVGLFRTEFLFEKEKPTMQMQQKAYEEIFALFDNITVRTLDVGGDKALPYINLPEERNPFLGIRGIRLIETHPDIIKEQLLAIFGAANNRPLKIMFPMVATLKEFNEAKVFAVDTAKKHNIDISLIQFGIMVEVPSVLFDIKHFNDAVDFYSVGTNDLSQYLFAIERTHPTLTVDPLSAELFSALKLLLEQATKPVSICGELASNEKAITKLIELGFTKLSVNPKSIAQTKETIRHV